WLERTRWPTIFKGSRRDILKAMNQLPRRYVDRLSRSDYNISQGPAEGNPSITSSWDDERKLACIVGAIDRMFDRCENTVQHISRFLLCWLLSTYPQFCHTRPFSLVAKTSTKVRYRYLWK
ncbi:hypothetical protein BGZ63DRAFT_368048, partial [Mariannaea sp. PMI_226]